MSGCGECESEVITIEEAKEMLEALNKSDVKEVKVKTQNEELSLDDIEKQLQIIKTKLLASDK